MAGKYSTASGLNHAILEAEEYDFDVRTSSDGTVTVPVSKILEQLNATDAVGADSVAVTAECEEELPYAHVAAPDSRRDAAVRLRAQPGARDRHRCGLMVKTLFKSLVPLATALVSACLAWLMLKQSGVAIATIVLGLFVIVGTASAYEFGESSLPEHPVQALNLMETQRVSYWIISAVGAALVIRVGLCSLTRA